MKIIRKYSFDINSEFGIYLPEGAEILTAQVEDGQACIFALTNELFTKTVMRKLRFIESSELIEPTEKLKYITTLQVSDSTGIVHLFEKLN